MDLPNDFKSKSFWERPEGFTGIIFGVGAIFGLWLLYPIILAAFNGLVLLGIIAGVAYLILDPKFRTLLTYGYKSLMRGITSLFKTLDPIGILKTYVERLKEKLEKIDGLLENLRGQIRKLMNLISKREQEAANLYGLANQAKKTNHIQKVGLYSSQAARLEEYNNPLKVVLGKAEVFYRVLNKMRGSASDLIFQIDQEVRIAKENYEMMNTTHAILGKVKKIVSEGAEKQLYDETMEYLAEDYGKKVGELEHFVEFSGDWIEKSDLEKGRWQDEGLKKLEEWEKRSSTLLGSEKANLISDAYDPNNVLDLENRTAAVSNVQATSDPDFKRLFH